MKDAIDISSDQDISDISDQDISTWKGIKRISFEKFKTVVRSILK